jgi:hypothetical protein
MSRTCRVYGRHLELSFGTTAGGQGNNHSGQLVFVSSVEPFVALRPSPLPQQPAGMPLRDRIVLTGMPDRATSPLRA